MLQLTIQKCHIIFSFKKFAHDENNKKKLIFFSGEIVFIFPPLDMLKTRIVTE